MAKRQSQVECPCCGALLFQPDYRSDSHDWDCFSCGLEVPNYIEIQGIDIVEAMRKPKLHKALRYLFPDITFGEAPVDSTINVDSAEDSESHPASPISQVDSKNGITSVDVMKLREWLGVTGGTIAEDVWQGMDEDTRKMYVCDVVKAAEPFEGQQ